MIDRIDTTVDALQSAKQRSGLSYQNLADQIGVSKGVIYNYMVLGLEPKDKAIRRRLNLDVEGQWIIQFVRRDQQGKFSRPRER